MSKLAPADSSAKKKGPIRLKEIVPEEIRFLFEPRPLLPGENPRHYDLLVACTIAEVKPRDLIEWCWVRDIVDCTWESRRLRLFKTGVIKLNMREAGSELLTRVFSPERTFITERTNKAVERAQNAMSGYLARDDEEAIAEVQGALDSLGVDEDALNVASFRYSLNSLEAIEALLTAVESRRSAILREIERRRFALGQHSRNTEAAEVIEFRSAGPTP